MVFPTAFGSRARPVSATLALARAAAPAHGVRRVFEITRMDRIGVPVFAAVRPAARTVYVNNGTGGTAEEAEVGALMEAIELAVAEAHWESRELLPMTPRRYREVTGGSLLDFGPILGRGVRMDQEMRFCVAHCVETGRAHPVPAELVVHPDHLTLDSAFLGWTSAGLASGNTALEASVHALCELMERDVQSIDALGDGSRLVPAGSLCPALLELDHAVRSAGLRAWLRWVPNVFGVPFFRYLIVDPDAQRLCFANGGFGAHPNATLAARRAMQEAIQSRAAMIHGGRDDLEDYTAFERALSAQERRDYLARLEAGHRRAAGAVGLDEIPSRPVGSDLAEQLADLVHCVRGAGLGPVLRYCYSQPHEPLQVVRLMVPGAENFTRSTMKVGRRLHQALRGRREAS